MASANLLNDNIHEKLRLTFGQVIGDDLRGEIEKIFLFDHPDCVGEKGRDCAVVLTTTGDVHAIEAIAPTENTSVSTGHQRVLKFPHLHARKLVDVCGLGFKDIAVSPSAPRHNIMAVAENGQLFAWGSNVFGLLGIMPSVSEYPRPVMVRGPLEKEVVVNIAIGDSFCACVTAAGEVWTWGLQMRGQLGHEHSTRLYSPCYKVQGGLERHRIVSLSCGPNFTMALSDQGQLWSWGGNDTCQLGHSGWTIHSTDVVAPEKVDLPKDATVERVACGNSHTLASTSDGRLYAWGMNNFGQLGNNDKEVVASATPLKVNLALGNPASFQPGNFAQCATEGASSEESNGYRVIEVAACNRLALSAAKTSNGEVYVWGKCEFETGTRIIAAPMLVPYSDLDTAFLSFSSPSTTFRLMSMTPAAKRPSIISCVRNSFNDETTADVKFVAEGRAIHAHKAFLKMRSEHFCGMFAKGAPWTETVADTINVLEFSYPVYHAFLFYLYTETLAEGLSPNDLLGLLDLAQSYCEDELRALCVARIAATIKCVSAPTFYLGALRCAAKDVEALSFNFMICHLADVVSSGALEELEGEALLLPLFEKVAQWKALRL